MLRIVIGILALGWLTACTPKIEVAAKEPITINLNVKIDHEIRVKVDSVKTGTTKKSLKKV
jgi:hypothetical protein